MKMRLRFACVEGLNETQIESIHELYTKFVCGDNNVVLEFDTVLGTVTGIPAAEVPLCQHNWVPEYPGSMSNKCTLCGQTISARRLLVQQKTAERARIREQRDQKETKQINGAIEEMLKFAVEHGLQLTIDPTPTAEPRFYLKLSLRSPVPKKWENFTEVSRGISMRVVDLAKFDVVLYELLDAFRHLHNHVTKPEEGGR